MGKEIYARLGGYPYVRARKAVLILGVCSWFAAGAGCSPSAPTTDLPTARVDAERFERTPLPGVAETGGDFPSGPPPSRPDLCGWADSVDAIVFGTLKSFELTMIPWVPLPSDGMTPTWDAPCEGDWQKPSLKFVVDIEESMKGDLVGEQVVYAPDFRLEYLDPSPRLDDEGSLIWVGVNGEPKEAPIHIGQKIGYALYHVAPYDVYTVMYEPFFGHDETGGAVFQPGGPSEAYQFYRAPDLSSEVDKLSEVKGAIASLCDGSSEIAVMRRRMMRAANDENIDINDLSPGVSFAAWCTSVDSNVDAN